MAFWEQIIVMSWIMEPVSVCVCVLICACPRGFIMRSLNLPSDELYSVCVCSLKSTPRDHRPPIGTASHQVPPFS